MELVKRIIADGIVLLMLSGLLGFFIKKWISETISYHFGTAIERNKALVEVEKRKALTLVDKRMGIYPEMLGLVYGLRNNVRDRLQSLRDYVERRAIPPSHIFVIGEELYLLTYKLRDYRAFIDEDTFEMLHRYKRILQDAQVLLNLIERPLAQRHFDSKSEEGLGQDVAVSYEQSAEDLEAINREVDNLYSRITKSVKQHIEAVLKR